MKKKWIAFLLSAAMLAVGLTGCGSEQKTPAEGGTDSTESTDDTGSTDKAEPKETTKVVLNEVAHSIFYAPMYAAIENDYFKEQGIELELVTGFGAIYLVQ